MGTSTTIKNLSMAVAGSAFIGLSAFSFPETAEAFSFTLYANQTEWQNALNGQPFQTEEFNGPNLPLGVSVNSLGVINNGVWEDQVSDEQTNTWNFAKPIFAWGGNFNLADVLDPGTGIAVTVADLLGDNYFVGEISNTLAGEFWGLVTDSPFNTVKLSKGSQGLQPDDRESYSLDDVVYTESTSEPEPIPEPAEIFGTLGFIGFLTFLRHKRR
ncbi:PEP-CTERM sorting domain-containing protein [Kamptonema sp. UHCC 0994]|uniref:PEP-CTERM sorting domain-containing protein n=1 Tax=Kamptonema sp. UHCC 0994 TaxID=3031329 RepID=UPI0023B9C1F9|nr:PEP-CTERM sorting domain-containing protein [Kamptonema sp. UHCC 0994]MDF0554856.1 PEP-CTERM sorting domain-containing protein [Kamptonema sp. UHCC 0994]